MAAASLLVVAAVRTSALKAHVSALMCEIAIEPSTANQVQRKEASPDETCRDLSGELSAIEAK
jgi:hypothetical protein